MLILFDSRQAQALARARECPGRHQPWRSNLERSQRKFPQGAGFPKRSRRFLARCLARHLDRRRRFLGCREREQLRKWRHQNGVRPASRASLLVRAGISRQEDRQRSNLQPARPHRRPPAVAFRQSGQGDEPQQRQGRRGDDQRSGALSGRPDHRSFPRRRQADRHGRNRPRQCHGFALTFAGRPPWSARPTAHRLGSSACWFPASPSPYIACQSSKYGRFG